MKYIYIPIERESLFSIYMISNLFGSENLLGKAVCS